MLPVPEDSGGTNPWSQAESTRQQDMTAKILNIQFIVGLRGELFKGLSFGAGSKRTYICRPLREDSPTDSLEQNLVKFPHESPVRPL